MKIWGRDLVSRQIAACLVLFVAAQLSYGAPLPPQQSAARQSAPAVQVAENEGGSGLPEAPQPQQTQQQQPQNAAADSGDQQDTQQNTPQKPVGTAAAPVTKPAGVAGSRPAGAAIAPAKQRRVRRLLVRWGIVLGAAAAVGTVAALSYGSQSRP